MIDYAVERTFVYSVPPFSGKNYKKNEEQVTGDDWPCAICGKAVADPYFWGRVHIDLHWLPEQAPEDEDQGCFPVGPECHRKFVVKETA